MSALTSFARMWLTRSPKRFTFKSENDSTLHFSDCDSLGLYVHIPFCRSICGFCPYCKQAYDEKTCAAYIDALLEEIRLVGGQSKEKKRVSSLYFGGGTPALAAERIGEIISTVEEYFIVTEGIGAELHPSDVTPDTLRTLKDAGVTKISIGIQSFSEKFSAMLARDCASPSALREALARVSFETVSMDFIFALPSQTFEDLKSDIDLAFSIGANHVAIYPFIDFSFTSNKLSAMGNSEKRRLLDKICAYCAEKGYKRDSIWTFSSDNARYSSMTRECFLGFGCSAVTLLRDSFKINTFSVRDYCARIAEKKLPSALTLRFSKRQRMVYYLFWTAYAMQVDSGDFKRFFGVSLKKVYRFELWLCKLFGVAREKDGVYTLTPKGAFYYHYFESFYTLSYIDKMWSVLRVCAFPERLSF